MLTNDPHAKCKLIEEVFGRIVPGETNVAIVGTRRRFCVGHPASKLWIELGYEASLEEVEEDARKMAKVLAGMAARAGAALVSCKSCHAPVWWAVTIHDKSTPMGADPSQDGCWVIDGQTENGAPRVRLSEPLTDPADTPRFQTHWATCPNADQHRKRNR
ncbi:MAG: hypothetical protein ACRBN8_22595 [Nannocystales bacterium]